MTPEQLHLAIAAQAAERDGFHYFAAALLKLLRASLDADRR